MSSDIVPVTVRPYVPQFVRASNAREIRQVMYLLPLVPLFVVAGSYVATNDPPLRDNDDLLYGFCKVALMFFLPLAVMLSVGTVLLTGTWVAGATGIEFVPFSRLRKRRLLQWSRVERVRWTYLNATLKGDGTTITIPLANFSTRDRELLEAAMKGALAPNFDLSLRPPRPALTPREWLHSAARVSLLVAVIAGLMALAHQLLPADAPRGVQTGVFMSMLFIPMLVAFRIAYVNSRTPDNPLRWRTRVALRKQFGGHDEVIHGLPKTEPEQRTLHTDGSAAVHRKD